MITALIRGRVADAAVAFGDGMRRTKPTLP